LKASKSFTTLKECRQEKLPAQEYPPGQNHFASAGGVVGRQPSPATTTKDGS
jgi:hypothetical protein